MHAQDYDAIVVGSGISGGWAEMELTPKGDLAFPALATREAGRGAVNFAGVFTEIKKSGWSGVMAIETDSTAFAADPRPLVAAGVEIFRSHAP